MLYNHKLYASLVLITGNLLSQHIDENRHHLIYNGSQTPVVTSFSHMRIIIPKPSRILLSLPVFTNFILFLKVDFFNIVNNYKIQLGYDMNTVFIYRPFHATNVLTRALVHPLQVQIQCEKALRRERENLDTDMSDV